ncbi:MAG: phosphoglucomutase/phosphomannomutase PgmG [Kiloniellaceae bacterium]
MTSAAPFDPAAFDPGAAHRFDPTVLREYALRGIVGTTIDAADAYALGRAFGSLAWRRGARALAVGYDGRHSSPALAAALAAGLAACGLAVAVIGRGPTPMLYFAAYTMDFDGMPLDGGVMVTGSHNPPDFNGFKLVLHKASVFGPDIQEVGRLAADADYEHGTGRIAELAVFQAYVARLLEDVKGSRRLKVAWDAGNGAMGEAMAAVTARLPGEHILLNAEIDGTFPNHHPDPTVAENLHQLQETVLREGCDLGIAFDGDGDRLGLVDSQARIVWGDQILLFLARDILKRHPGATIIGDVKCSEVLFDGIAAAGGKPLMWKTGHSVIKAKMKELGAPFAGEMAAHFVFADGFYGYDDGLYAAIRVLSILQSSTETLAGFRDGLPEPMNTPELRVPCPEDRKAAVVEEVKARLAAEGAAEGAAGGANGEVKVTAIDGVRVREKGGWWLLRASNTEAALTLRCEAPDAAGLKALTDRLAAQLKASGLEPPAF